MRTDPHRPLVALHSDQARGVEFVFRPTELNDLDSVLALEVTPENARFVTVWPREKHAAALADPGVDHSLLVSEGRPIGYFILRGLGGPSIEALRLVVGPKGLGIGTCALREVERHVFATLGAHRLWLDVICDNLRARRVYEKAGFVVEGVLREAHLRGEEYLDLVVMSKLRSEWIIGREGGS